MKRFLGRLTVAFVGVMLLFLCFNILYYKLGRQSKLVAFEVYDAIDVAETQTEYKKVVLGDSVARQFFNPNIQQEDKEICYLPTNQAIMTVGNYILLEEYLKNNPQTEAVYYVARPDSLCSEMNFHYTYSYFITPFYTEKNQVYLEQKTVDEIERMFGKCCVESNFAKWMLAKYPKMLEFYHNICGNLQKLQSRGGQDDDMPILYLSKINTLCTLYDIEFHLVSVPLPEDYDFDFEELESRMAQYGMKNLYAELQDSVQYAKKEEFVDGIHLNEEYVEENGKMAFSMIE